MAERIKPRTKVGGAQDRVREARKTKAVARTAARQAQEFRVERWMTMPVITIRPRDSVAHARAILEEHRINQLPVVVNRRLVGIVTDRDLRDAPRAVEISAKVSGADIAPVEATPEQIPVEEVMTAKVLTLAPSDTLQQAAELMRRERIGAVPIVERGRLVGILTRSDILGAFTKLCR